MIMPTPARAILYWMGALSFFFAAGSAQSTGERVHAFSIEPQALGEALPVFSDQSGTSLSYSAEVARSQIPVSLVGHYLARDGLEQLLEGTGYEAREILPGLFDIVLVTLPAWETLSGPDTVSATPAAGIGPRSDAGLEDVVTVSARRRVEPAAALPLSAHIVSRALIDARGDHDILSAAGVIPNLVFRPFFASAANVPVVRGFIGANGNIGKPPRVTLFQDGIYAGRSLAVDIGVTEFDQIEVVPGPQGTFFGRNTFAGLVNVVTRKPTDDWASSLTVEGGSQSRVRGSGMLNIPLGRRFALQVDGMYSHHRGYGENVLSGRRINDRDRFRIRAITTIRLTSETSVDLGIRALEAGNPEGIPLSGFFRGVPQSGQHNVANDVEAVYRRKALNAWGTLNHRFSEAAKIKASIGYVRGREDGTGDGDVSELPLLLSTVGTTEESLTADITAEVDLGSRLNLIAGMFYLTEKISGVSSLSAVGTAFAPPLFFTAKTKTDSIAPYVHADLVITERLSFDAGLRLTAERRSIRFARIADPFAANLIGYRDRLHESHWTPTFGFRFAAGAETTLFIRTSKGFTSGGWNTALDLPESDIKADPEIIWSYEAGIRLQSRDGRLSFDAVGFLMESTNYLLPIDAVVSFADPLPEAGQRFTGDVRSVGFEASLTMTVDGWTIVTGVGFVHAYFTSFPDGGGRGVDFTGNELPSAPRWTINLGVLKSLSLGSWGHVDLYGEFLFQDRSFGDGRNTGIFRSDETRLVNFRITYRPGNERWQVFGYMNNLTDRNYARERLATTLQDTPTFVGEPRTWGIGVSVRL